MRKIGLIAMSAKPFHLGHSRLIQLASQECNFVNLYVSISDRARTGEIPILGKDMLKLWHDIIEPSLPTNVKITYGGSPIGNIWMQLGEANESKSDDQFWIYSDPTDLAQNFTKELLMKYSGNLFEAGKIKLRAVERSTTANVSGTQMRQYLESGDKANFMKYLPVDIDRESVWDILHNTAKNPPKIKTTAGPSKKPAVKKSTQRS